MNSCPQIIIDLLIESNPLFRILRLTCPGILLSDSAALPPGSIVGFSLLRSLSVGTRV
jgi:hypothetical protein